MTGKDATNPTGFDRSRLIRELEISTSHKLVLMLLDTYADAGGLCWPSVPRIVAETGLSRATVYRVLKDLDESGIARIVGNAGGGRSQSVRRRINWTLIAGGGALSQGAELYVNLAGRRASSAINAAAQARKGSQSETLSQPERVSQRDGKGLTVRQKGSHSETRTCHSNKPTKETIMHGADDSAPRGWDGMDETEGDARSELRAALRGFGVRGPNLDRLSDSPGLTLKIIAKERAEISRDRSIAYPAAVLVRRLADRLELDLRKAPAKHRPSDQDRATERRIHAATHKRSEIAGAGTPTGERFAGGHGRPPAPAFPTGELLDLALSEFLDGCPEAVAFVQEHGREKLLKEHDARRNLIRIADQIASHNTATAPELVS